MAVIMTLAAVAYTVAFSIHVARQYQKMGE